MTFDTTPVVLVHGFWHASWCWSPVIQKLAAKGILSVAVDLAAHGLNARAPRTAQAQPFDLNAFATEPSAVAEITASVAATDLLASMRLINGGRPCHVVAHSMGGAVVTAAAELEPDLFSSITYVSAFAPVAGISSFEYLGSDEAQGSLIGALLCGNPFETGASRLNLGDVELRSIATRAFYNDLDDDYAAAAIALLSHDAPLAMATEVLHVSEGRFGAIPHAYVTCSLDNTIPPALQQRFILELDAISARPTQVVALEASHSPFFSLPGELADAIELVTESASLGASR